MARAVYQINRALDRFVRKEMTRTGTPGVAVGILYGRSRYTNGYGVTNVEHPLTVTPNTLFQIGSTTKTFTATAIMQLVEQGKVDLDAPVRRYLPELRLKNAEATRRTTLRHLLTHTGGWIGDYFEDTGWGDDALARVVSKMGGLKQLTPLGKVWSYNNSGFYLAGRVIEKITKKTYEAAIREMLFEPLGMTNSFFFPEEVIHRRFVVGHITEGRKSRVATPWRLPRSSAPAGAIISTVDDQLTWAAFHLGDIRASGGKRLLRKATLQMMQREQLSVGSMADAMGISWLISYIPGGVKQIAHGGTTIGQLSAFVLIPSRSFAVTVLTNSTRGREVHASVVQWALENYLGLDLAPAPPLRLDPPKLREYAGKYRVETNGDLVTVTARNSTLVLTIPSPAASSNSARAPRIPPISLRFHAPDKITVASGAYKGIRSDFLRGPDGKVRWLRFGGRLYRKAPDRKGAGGKSPRAKRAQARSS